MSLILSQWKLVLIGALILTAVGLYYRGNYHKAEANHERERRMTAEENLRQERNLHEATRQSFARIVQNLEAINRDTKALRNENQKAGVGCRLRSGTRRIVDGVRKLVTPAPAKNK